MTSTLDGRIFTPAFDGYFADPFVWEHGGRYWAVGTGPAEAAGEPEGVRRVVPVLVSDDLKRWTPLGGALVPPAGAAGDGAQFWAPEVAYADGAFWMYYSTGHDPAHHLRVARAEAPQGPYGDCGLWLTSEERGIPFAIDGAPFLDDDGTRYLFYARDFLDSEGGHHTGTGLAVDRLETMTRLAGEERMVLRARHTWTLFEAQRSIYNARYDWHTVEGPAVVKRRGRYWCLFSGSRWEGENYGVDWAVADHPLGPWSGESPEGPRLLRSRPGLVGPGHNSLVVGPDGEDYIVFHAWDEARTKRQMYVERLEWTDDGPILVVTG